MEGARVEVIIVDVALLGWRDRNLLVIASAGILENGLKMIFLVTQVSMSLSSTRQRAHRTAA